MIWNIIDKRERRYRWQRITAIVEPTWHDNTCADSDQTERAAGEIEYDEREAISLADAIQWANEMPFPVTLFLYDLSKGTNTVNLPLG
jgi:hypothetical protein